MRSVSLLRIEIDRFTDLVFCGELCSLKRIQRIPPPHEIVRIRPDALFRSLHSVRACWARSRRIFFSSDRRMPRRAYFYRRNGRKEGRETVAGECRRFGLVFRYAVRPVCAARARATGHGLEVGRRRNRVHCTRRLTSRRAHQNSFLNTSKIFENIILNFLCSLLQLLMD